MPDNDTLRKYGIHIPMISREIHMSVFVNTTRCDMLIFVNMSDKYTIWNYGIRLLTIYRKVHVSLFVSITRGDMLFFINTTAYNISLVP